MNQIKYREGYKYQLAEDYSIETGITGSVLLGDFLALDPSGLLTIKRGYAWDGMSGPVPDTPENMRASLVHDALYQLMRMGVLPPEAKAAADDLMHDILLKDGYHAFRAWVCHQGVDRFGEPHTLPENRKPILTAPLAEVVDHSVDVEAGDR